MQYQQLTGYVKLEAALILQLYCFSSIIIQC